MMIKKHTFHPNLMIHLLSLEFSYSNLLNKLILIGKVRLEFFHCLTNVNFLYNVLVASSSLINYPK